MPRMSARDIEDFLEAEFPAAKRFGARIGEVSDTTLELVLPTDERHIRPGGTVSGPVLMTLADTAAYFVLLAQIGPVALAVTSSLEIHFLRKPIPGELRAVARILKLGKRTAVTTVEIEARGVDGLVAHATVSYALPSASPK
jgi:uncharacterized protein (TIGR00369 family)